MFCFLTISERYDDVISSFSPNTKIRITLTKNEWKMERKGNIAKGKVCQLENAKKKKSVQGFYWVKALFFF
jgi:hypothetical protein